MLLYIYIGFLFFILDTPRLIKRNVGQSVQLHCSIKYNHTKFLGNSKIYWYFMFYGRKLTNDVKEYSGFQENWIKLMCDGSSCKSILNITNLKSYQSGIYKCTVNPYKLNNSAEFRIQLVKYFHLEVEDSSVSIPKILGDSPKNKTCLIGNQVYFECRVYSKVHLRIKWFRSLFLTNGFESSTTVKYYKNFYELLNSPREKVLPDDIYYSKLILNNVSHSDIGIYACVAINYFGHNVRQGFLEVLKEDHSHINEFLILFTFPITLLVIPIFIWTTYICCKRNKTSV